jgi:hypothetical protein
VTATGVVQRYTTSATGAVDGFVLDDGTTVHFPGYLGPKVSALLGENAQVRVNGLLVSGTRPGATSLLEARTITDLKSKRTLTVTGSGAALPGSTTTDDGAGDTATGAGGAGGGAAGGAGGAAGGAGGAGGGAAR